MALFLELIHLCSSPMFLDYLIFSLVGVFVKMQMCRHCADLSAGYWWEGLETGPNKLYFFYNPPSPPTISASIWLHALPTFQFIWLSFCWCVLTLVTKALNTIAHVSLCFRGKSVLTALEAHSLYYGILIFLGDCYVFL